MFESINDVSETFVKVCESIITKYGRDLPTEEDIWQISTNYVRCPHLGNIYQDQLGLIATRLIDGICPQADATYDVNAKASYFHAFGFLVDDADWLFERIEVTNDE